MNTRLLCSTLAFAVVSMFIGGRASAQAAAADQPPSEWIESETGHRVVRLSDEPGSQSLYFHQHPFTADGKKLLFTTPHGISAVDLATRKIEEVVAGPVNLIVTGRKTGDAYYMQDGAIHAANIATGKTRLVAKLPEQYRWSFNAGANFRPPGSDNERRPDGDPAERRGRDFERFRRNFGWGNVAINADETILVGIGRDPDGQAVPRTPPSGQELGGRLGPRWAAGLPLLMYTIDLATGDTKVIHRSNDWLNHLQCSPTDPGQVLFCHEGPWHLVDRTWLIRTDGSGLKQIHPRTIDMEIEGHEFFSTDGKAVWYDLQTPRSMVFWLASYDIDSGRRTWYHVERPHWSVHYNISADGKLFCGDGGGPSSVANMSANFEILDPPQNGQWMYLFRPELVSRTGMPEQAAKQVKAGVLHAERLVDLSKHDYELEPNGIFTPDGKWVVFRSNLHGPTHVYAVEVERAAHRGSRLTMTPHFGPTNPTPEEQAASGVRRYLRLVELKPEKEEVYRQMHGNVWPEVVAALGRANIHNYSIYIAELGGKKYLIAYFEYTGDDAERDFAIVAEDSTTRDKWWPITDDCQVRIPGTPEGEQWLPAELVMYLP